MPRPSAPRSPDRSRKGEKDAGTPPVTAERIAKLLSRAGVASRRDAEAMVAAGRVAVNGTVLTSPATLVRPGDRITVDGTPVAEPERPRLWRYHKPTGVVTTARDEQGRTGLPEALPADLPRVMPVGRLDITSEGLLLLTNDGGLKRRLELPSTGWLRRYRVRVNGTPDETRLAPLREGLVIEGERFQPMQVMIDRQQGANAWLTVGLREGRNREVRRAMEAVGLTVNRLIRISYGPFQLGDLAPGAVEEIRPRVLREQLGLDLAAEDEPRPDRRRAGRDAPGAAADPSVSLRAARGGGKQTAAGKPARPRKPRPPSPSEETEPRRTPARNSKGQPRSGRAPAAPPDDAPPRQRTPGARRDKPSPQRPERADRPARSGGPDRTERPSRPRGGDRVEGDRKKAPRPRRTEADGDRDRPATRQGEGRKDRPAGRPARPAPGGAPGGARGERRERGTGRDGGPKGENRTRHDGNPHGKPRGSGAPKPPGKGPRRPRNGPPAPRGGRDGPSRGG